MRFWNRRLPETPTWRMFVALLAMMFVGMVLTVSVLSGFQSQVRDLRLTQSQIRRAQDESKERGFVNRSVACMALIIDNDRTFPLTQECLVPEVAAYYPKQACDSLPVATVGCGARVDAVPG